MCHDAGDAEGDKVEFLVFDYWGNGGGGAVNSICSTVSGVTKISKSRFAVNC